MRFPLLLAAFFAISIFGGEHAFILQDVDSNQILIQEGDVSTFRSPYCSFNICLSLIGFDSEVLQDPENPLWPFKDEYEDEYRTFNGSFPERWRGSQTPASWMKYSVVWYSQALTRKLGMKTFADYVTALGYGNQNLIGDLGKANGLTHAWIGSSLRISPLEQVRFVKQLVKQELPVSAQAHQYTKAILFVEELPHQVKLYGKTGSGDYANGRQAPESKIGWFVGWAEQGDRRVAFAYKIEGREDSELPLGGVARESLKLRLAKFFELHG